MVLPIEEKTMKECEFCKTHINNMATICPNCKKEVDFLTPGTIAWLVALVTIWFLTIWFLSFNQNTSTRKTANMNTSSFSKTTSDNDDFEIDTWKPRFTDGTYMVGSEIEPGTYRIRKPTSHCYYSRIKGFGGTIDEIISNGNTNSVAIVTISPTDKGFKSSGCGTWTQDLSPVTNNATLPVIKDATAFEDGTYIVWMDIQPGTYKNTAVESYCYYSRLKGFGGTIDEIISNGNTNSVAIVTISPTDKGFKSSGCGTWNMIK